MGPGTQGGSLAPRLHHWAVRHLCILGIVARLSDSQCQEENKQDPKIGMLRNNRGNGHYSYQCGGSTYLPPPTRVIGTE